MCADFTMCCNNKCPSRELCRRFTAEPASRYQSFSDFKPAGGDDRCGNFMAQRPVSKGRQNG
jgi:hypothetical protein